MKTFVLREQSHYHKLRDYLREHAGHQAAANRPLVCTITEYKQTRSNDQNARYWALLTEISESVQLSGKWFNRDVWHEWFKQKFAPKSEAPDGSLIPMSTTGMNVEQFAKYMMQIESYAAQELGVEFAAL